jgi:ornithine carbamoyltransferase
MRIAGRFGMDFVAATPEGYAPGEEVTSASRRDAEASGGSVTRTHDAREAAAGAQVLYTDVWTSMGQDLETDERALVFPSYQLSQKLVDLADPEVVVLHCLPAHRGQEITDEVIDGPRSVVWDQAENRLHTQKALLLRLFGVA